MNIVFRVDASEEIGSGHVMRCLTLADELRKRDAKILFLHSSLKGNLSELILNAGFLVVHLSYNSQKTLSSLKNDWLEDAEYTQKAVKEEIGYADVIILDHYAFEEKWERHVRNIAAKVVVIDDLATNQHDCDLLLNQNLLPSLIDRYDKLIPKNAVLLTGPGFALIRNEFYGKRRLRKAVSKVVLFFGGSDPTGETVKAMRALKQITNHPLQVSVVVGSSNPLKEEIERFCKEEGYSFYCQISYLSDIYCEGDLVIGAGGISIIERLIIGVPSIVIAVADNQIEVSSYAQSKGIVEYLGESKVVDEHQIAKSIKKFLLNPLELSNVLSAMNEYSFENSGAYETSMKIEELCDE